MFVRVAVPVPNLDLLTYLVPAGTAAPALGARVVVPLGTRSVTGIVVDVVHDAAMPDGKQVNQNDVFVLSEARSMTPQAVADYLAKYAGN